MNQLQDFHPALLPSGFGDILPPEAELQARLAETVMDHFAAHGYQRVNPPLMEFEDSLFAGSGAATSDQTFRLMDPESHRMMGVRADTTPQVGRLAATRLAAAPRPLRLAYAGQCLKVRGSHLQPERQFSQAGIELIGDDSADADAEIVTVAAEALAAIGLEDVSFDLTMPRLVLHLLQSAGLDEDFALTHALDRKDSATVRARGGAIAPTLLALLAARGPVEQAIPALLAIDLPAPARAQAQRMAEAVAVAQAAMPGLKLTADGVEFRGYRYHTGLCVTVFAHNRQAELGRGGRFYSGDAEPSTGLTLYPDAIARIAPPARLRRRLFVPAGTPWAEAAAQRAQGFATVAGRAGHTAPEAEARRLGCSHFWRDGAAQLLPKGS